MGDMKFKLLVETRGRQEGGGKPRASRQFKLGNALGDLKAQVVVETIAKTTRSEVEDTSRLIKAFEGR